MTTIAQALSSATQQLRPVTDTPRLDAEILLGHVLNLSRASLLARLRDALPAPASAHFEALVLRRLHHEPIAYILGHWEFFSLEFVARAPILVPRPETEHLVEVALEHIGSQPARVLDLCTGTGCVAIAIARNAPGAAVFATDLNPAAVQLARENAVRLQAPLEVFEGDLFAALPPETLAFDVVTANPPYVPAGEWASLPEVIQQHEDPAALLAGPDGLDLVRRIAQEAWPWVKQEGLLAMEIGEDQYAATAEILAQSGWKSCNYRKDLAGIKRIIFASR